MIGALESERTGSGSVRIRQPTGDAPIAVVAGALANKPHNGGEAWVRMSWAGGLARLGFRVLFVEQIRAQDCVDAEGAPAPFSESVNRSWFRSVTAAFGLTGWACLLCDDGQCEGISLAAAIDRAETASLLVNISGHLVEPSLIRGPRVRIFLDIDPGFTQYWHLQQSAARLEGHDQFFTIAEGIGTESCSIPGAGVPWKVVRQPVLMDWWGAGAASADAPFTTVATWRCPFGPIETEDRRYSLKLHQFRRFAEFPRSSGRRFQAALDIHPADSRDARALTEGGWEVVDARTVAGDPFAFRDYVEYSLGEFSVAQGIYVETRSGWFSDRSTRYLAAGRPVILQDTGFGDHLPVGEGLVAFSDQAEAKRAVDDVASRYQDHSEAARDVARRCFSSDLVLERFLGLAEVGG